jgi:hypothetical protein
VRVFLLYFVAGVGCALLGLVLGLLVVAAVK